MIFGLSDFWRDVFCVSAIVIALILAVFFLIFFLRGGKK